MAKCELSKNILSISGKIGNLVFKTYKRRDGTTETRAYRKPTYERKTPPGKKELAARSRFSSMAKQVAERMLQGDKRPKSLIWAEVKEEFKDSMIQRFKDS